MASAPGPASRDDTISSQVRLLYNSFGIVLANCRQTKDGERLDDDVCDSLEDARSKFTLWAGNLGAAQKGTDTRSLDYRLRSNPEVAHRLRTILNGIQEELDTISGARRSVNHEAEHSRPSSQDEAEALLLGFGQWETSDECRSAAAIAALHDSIRRLFRVAQLIGKSSAEDKYARAQAHAKRNEGETFLACFDIAHIQQKFAGYAAEDWFLNRLGKANTLRRQYFKYAREHHKRLEQTKKILGVGEGKIKEQSSAVDSQTVEAASRQHSHPRTKASDTSALSTVATKLGPIDVDALDTGFDENVDRSTIATSIAEEHTPGRLEVIPLSDVSAPGEPFVCPYCNDTQRFNAHFSWSKHVLADLRAYMCTYKNCGLMMFDTKRAWMDHEMQYHRRCWSCQLCDLRESSRTHLSKHIHQKHHEFEPDQIDLLLMTSERPQQEIAASECKLCGWEAYLRTGNKQIASDVAILVPAKRFMRHLANHMEQVALFALPKLYIGDAEENTKLSHKNARARSTIASSSSSSPAEIRTESNVQGEASSRNTFHSRKLSDRYYDGLMRTINSLRSEILNGNSLSPSSESFQPSFSTVLDTLELNLLEDRYDSPKEFMRDFHSLIAYDAIQHRTEAAVVAAGELDRKLMKEISNVTWCSHAARTTRLALLHLLELPSESRNALASKTQTELFESLMDGVIENERLQEQQQEQQEDTSLSESGSVEERTHMEPRAPRREDWDRVREVIEVLYTKEGRAVPEIRDILSDKHAFKASIVSYKRKLAEWKFVRDVFLTVDSPDLAQNGYRHAISPSRPDAISGSSYSWASFKRPCRIDENYGG